MRSLSPAALAAFATIAFCTAATAQFTDLQPGRNFQTALSLFGGNRSENIDVGDVDNDGDLDVIVANGGDFGDEPNRIYINQGGLQGGSVGTFSQETSSRFAGVPNDTSRDIEFADMDNDGDLDIYVSNRGGNTTGQVSRFYINQGGLQGGTIGFYSEDTANRWGNLSSVPIGDQEFGGDHGPWRDWSCDCDFADLDDDGDLDLFHSSYGPSIGGNRRHRIFLNDGTGEFNELDPWVDAGADIETHALDIDIVDLDGDLDFDIVNSSRNSQARIFMNNLYNPTSGSSELFTDTTQASLINTGSTLSGTSNYEAEFGDLDDDGDFDVWMKNYDGFIDKILINNGTNASGAVLFAESDGPGPDLIKGDPNNDENEVDFLDFDGDGDLDVFVANFSGTNHIYAGGNAQGGSLAGTYHRTGTTSGGSSYSFNETPTSSNSGQTLDGEVGDMDNDGDPDLLLSNDSGQSNRYWENVLGIPDTHAPSFYILQDSPGGAGTVVHAQLRDNNAYYMIDYYDVDLTYSIDGAPDVTVGMFAQRSQQFRAEIPGSVDARCIEYFVTATDDAGNTTVSPTVQIGCTGPNPWTNLGDALAGTNGLPALAGTGTLMGGSSNSLVLTSGKPNETSALFTSFVDTPVPFKGGTLHTVPISLTLILATSPPGGGWTLPFTFPGGIPAGFTFVFQTAIDDTGAVQGVALSNALVGEAQ